MSAARRRGGHPVPQAPLRERHRLRRRPDRDPPPGRARPADERTSRQARPGHGSGAAAGGVSTACSRPQPSRIALCSHRHDSRRDRPRRRRDRRGRPVQLRPTPAYHETTPAPSRSGGGAGSRSARAGLPRHERRARRRKAAIGSRCARTDRPGYPLAAARGAAPRPRVDRIEQSKPRPLGRDRRSRPSARVPRAQQVEWNRPPTWSVSAASSLYRPDRVLGRRTCAGMPRFFRSASVSGQTCRRSCTPFDEHHHLGAVLEQLRDVGRLDARHVAGAGLAPVPLRARRPDTAWRP